MLTFRNDLIEMLRGMARRGEKPSVMLRALLAELGSDMGDRPLLMRYISTAFCFIEGQGYKTFSWFPDGTWALQDADIDRIFLPRIQRTQTEWDKESLQSFFAP